MVVGSGGDGRRVARGSEVAVCRRQGPAEESTGALPGGGADADASVHAGRGPVGGGW